MRRSEDMSVTFRFPIRFRYFNWSFWSIKFLIMVGERDGPNPSLEPRRKVEKLFSFLSIFVFFFFPFSSCFAYSCFPYWCAVRFSSFAFSPCMLRMPTNSTQNRFEINQASGSVSVCNNIYSSGVVPTPGILFYKPTEQKWPIYFCKSIFICY